MNEISLSHSYTKKQYSSMIDDFDFKERITGVMRLNAKQFLYDHCQYLVEQYAKFNGDHYLLSTNELPEDEQNILANLYIESTNRETSECVYGNDFSIESDFTCALLAMLKEDNKDTRDHFADVTRQNIIIYYSNSLNGLLEIACSSHLNNSMDNAGFYQSQDLVHGDHHWSKI